MNIKVISMTQTEIKKLDRKLRVVQDPFGTGFLSVYTIFRETAETEGIPLASVIRQYNTWKLKSV